MRTTGLIIQETLKGGWFCVGQAHVQLQRPRAEKICRKCWASGSPAPLQHPEKNKMWSMTQRTRRGKKNPTITSVQPMQLPFQGKPLPTRRCLLVRGSVLCSLGGPQGAPQTLFSHAPIMAPEVGSLSAGSGEGQGPRVSQPGRRASLHLPE